MHNDFTSKILVAVVFTWCVICSHIKGKCKVILVLTMKAYRGSRGVAPLILNLGTRWCKWSALHASASLDILRREKISCTLWDRAVSWRT